MSGYCIKTFVMLPMGDPYITYFRENSLINETKVYI
jgi:hypothetical protein